MGLKPGFGRLARIGEAMDAFNAHPVRLQTELIALPASAGRVLAEDVVAGIDVPHFDKSAMDGYAVIAGDTFAAGQSGAVQLRLAGALTPGIAATGVVARGSCIEIGTGSPMPPGADAVVIVEHTEPGDEGLVRINRPVAPGANIIRTGSDVRCGRPVLSSGTRLAARHLGALAAIGRTSLRVFRRPIAALGSTGPELVEAGGSIGAGKIFDINRVTLSAALEADGCEVLDLGIIPDDRQALDEALGAAAGKAGFVLLSGGSSLGATDLVLEAFGAAGEVLIHGVAVKPGKPLSFAVSPSAMPMIGLPGYPMSALSDYYVFVRPWLASAMGCRPAPPATRARLGSKYVSAMGRYEFVPVRLDGDIAHPNSRGSSSITALTESDGFIEIDETTEVLAAGEPVDVRLM